MKYCLFLIALLLQFESKACACMEPEFMAKYIQSDFVARVTIKENFPNQGSELYYKSNIIIHELYKGNPVTSILIEGSSDGVRRSSCDIFFKTGTEMLIYAIKNKEGKYIFDSCSGYLTLTGKYKSEKRELEMLAFLKSAGIRHTNKNRYMANFQGKLDSLQALTLEKTFAMFEIHFDGALTVQSVKTISGFNLAVDQKLINILKQTRWKIILPPGNEFDNIPIKSRLIFAFYYYPAEGKHQSFISQNSL